MRHFLNAVLLWMLLINTTTVARAEQYGGDYGMRRHPFTFAVNEQYEGQPGWEWWTCHGRSTSGMVGLQAARILAQSQNDAANAHWALADPGSHSKWAFTMLCHPESQAPLRPWLCTSSGTMPYSTTLIELPPVRAFGYNNTAAAEDGWWMNPRESHTQPLLLHTVCVGAKTVADEQDPSDALWTCDEKEGDEVPPVWVRAQNRTEAAAWALVEWELIGDEMNPTNILCRPDSGPMPWTCSAELRDAAHAAPVLHVSAETWEEAAGYARGQWSALQVPVADSTVNCFPTGNTGNAGPTVAWYCAGQGESGCKLPPVRVFAGSDEYEVQVALLAQANWTGANETGTEYGSVFASVNCAHAGQWIPPWEAQAWTCEDSTVSLPGQVVTASSESAAVAVAQETWGAGAVEPEATSCHTGTPVGLCEVSAAGPLVLWSCGGVSTTGAPCDTWTGLARNFVEASTAAVYAWDRGKPPVKKCNVDVTTVSCEESEPTDPGQPPQDPDMPWWSCTANRSSPFPGTVTAKVQAHGVGNAITIAQESWIQKGWSVYPWTITCWPIPAP